MTRNQWIKRGLALLLAICLLPIAPAFAREDSDTPPTTLPLPIWTVTFHWNHPDALDEGIYSVVQVPEGGLVSQPLEPLAAGWIFLGWFEAIEAVPLDSGGAPPLLSVSDFSNFFDFDIPITADLDLYARWVLEPAIPLTTKHYAYLIGDDRAYVRPLDNITRAEVATVFFRLLDSTYRKYNWTRTNPFPDVYSDVWYNTAVSTIYAIGLLDGLPGGSFNPYASMTRAEFASLVAALFSLDSVVTEDAFLDISDSWARDAINLLAAAHILQVPEDRLFRPQAFIARGEVSAIINRAMGRIPENVWDINLPQARYWRDNANENSWYYLDVQEATNSHDYVRKADQIHETWTALLPPPRWAAMQEADAAPG